MNSLAFLATTFGIVAACGYYPQAWKMFRTKSVKDISPLAFSVFFMGNTTWEIYGISIKNWPLMISQFVGIVGTFLVLFLYSIYKGGKYGAKEILDGKIK